MRTARLVMLSVVAACGRDRPPPRDQAPSARPILAAPAPAPAPAAPAPVAAPGERACALAPLPLRRPAPRRLVAIGDVHGDLAATRAALRAAGAIDARDRWSGGDLVVVQTGDVLDRGDDEQAILDLVARLEREAEAAGGALVLLLGNHELMNAAGDFRYVTPGGMRDFDDAPGVDPGRAAGVPGGVPEAMRGRVAALAPGGAYARRLAGHDVVELVGDTVFSHAGVLGDWVTQVEAANRTARCWLDGQAGGMEDAPPVLTAPTSPVWTREVGMPEVDCGRVRAALAALGASRMVVGHTVQREINAVCDGAVWRIDVGLARYYGGPIQVLELAPGPPRVLTGAREP